MPIASGALRDELAQPNSIVVVDSLRLWGELKQHLALSQLATSQLRALLIAMKTTATTF